MTEGDAADGSPAVQLLLSVHRALQEQGWGALLSAWHAMIVGLAIGELATAPPPDLGPPDPPRGTFESDAAIRWRRLCAEAGLDPDDGATVLTVLEALGVVEVRRSRLRARWALVEPVPAAEHHPDLELETRAAAVDARRRFDAGVAIGGLLEDGGPYRSPSREALAADAGVDLALLDELAGEPDSGWRIVQSDTGVRLEQLPDEEVPA